MNDPAAVVVEPPKAPGKMLVWDLPLRTFHWLLALAVLGSWITHKIGPEAFVWHKYIGYTTLVLIAFRIAWGFFGSRHARFWNFLRGPRAVWRYACTLPRRDPEHHAGHNPMGGWMVMVFLFLLLAQGITGLFANDEIADTGPLYGYVSDELSDRITGWHETLSEVLWIAIGLHLAVVFGYLLVKRHNLIVPMMTGRKSTTHLSPGEGIAGSRIVLALILVAACAGALYWIVRSAPPASMEVFF